MVLNLGSLIKTPQPSPFYMASKQTKRLDFLKPSRNLPSLVNPASENLLDFTRYTMPDYEANWHHLVVCRYLDAFLSGDIPRLMVFMPPRHGKSELVSRRLPAYILGRNPNAQIITASYGADLARRMNRDVQRIIDDEAYQRIFPNTKLFGKNIRSAVQGTWLRNSDIFEVCEYSGVYRGAGVGAGITGMGMNYGIIDDPLKNRKEANSLVVRDAIWDWYTSTFRTRLAPGGGILLTVTRWHEDDLPGRLLALAASDPAADQWEVINLPAVAEKPLADYDPRQVGDALWPDRFDLDDLERTRVSLGSYDWNSLYQQRPAPPEGGMFKRQWFGDLITASPRQARRVRYWDKAGTDTGEGAYTAGVLVARDANGMFYIEDVVRGRYSALDREQVIKQTAQTDKELYGAVTIYTEQEPGSGGKESAEATVRNLAGFVVHAERVTGDKVTRAQPFAAQCEAHNVKIVKADWNAAYLAEMTNFPNGKYKDQVDASAGAFNKLAVPTYIPPLAQGVAKVNTR